MKSPEGTIHFADFTLDPGNRLLLRGDEPVELGGRYFDALVMLVRERGQLISKDRLHEEVWRGVPVTDEALSQAIMALRRALGDDAARPRFIETVPRHGYRFIGELKGAVPQSVPERSSDETLPLVTGGILGALATGLLVGLVYGTLATDSGSGGAFSLLLVLLAVSVLAALVSGLGIAGGIGIALRQGGREWWRPVVGGGLGGLLVGGFARLLGNDTLRLLLGNAPNRMAGAAEGVAIGIVVGIAFWLIANGSRRLGYGVAVTLGGLAGLGLVATGGTLMAGSLAALVTRFPGAALSMAWAREPLWLALSGGFEGAAFAALVSAGLATKGRLPQP